MSSHLVNISCWGRNYKYENKPLQNHTSQKKPKSTAADFRMRFWMCAYFQGVLNHYIIKWRLEIIVSCLVPLPSFELRWTLMTMALNAFLSVLRPNCNSVCRLRCDKSWRVCLDCHHSSAVIEPCNPISCENCFLSYGDFCVLYSAKLCFVFGQKWLIAGICSAAWGNFKWDIRKCYF